jgi:hypothetical protein
MSSMGAAEFDHSHDFTTTSAKCRCRKTPDPS